MTMNDVLSLVKSELIQCQRIVRNANFGKVAPEIAMLKIKSGTQFITELLGQEIDKSQPFKTGEVKARGRKQGTQPTTPTTSKH